MMFGSNLNIMLGHKPLTPMFEFEHTNHYSKKGYISLENCRKQQLLNP
jgi:hypothetical protein